MRSGSSLLLELRAEHRGGDHEEAVYAQRGFSDTGILNFALGIEEVPTTPPGTRTGCSRYHCC